MGLGDSFCRRTAPPHSRKLKKIRSLAFSLLMFTDRLAPFNRDCNLRSRSPKPVAQMIQFGVVRARIMAPQGRRLKNRISRGRPTAGTTRPASTSRFGLKIEVDNHKKSAPGTLLCCCSSRAGYGLGAHRHPRSRQVSRSSLPSPNRQHTGGERAGHHP
jgi:hypothetical protein